MNRKEFLEYEIQKHNKLYWKDGKPEISDPDYDKLIEELRELDPNNSLINKINTPTVSSNGKVKHIHEMLSLDKMYNVEDLIKWCEKVARNEKEEFLIQLKYDGCSAELANGILSTRGDGIYGEDITSKLPIVKIIAPGTIHDYVRGEILIENETFENIKGDYKTSRNMCAGILRRDDVDTSKGKILTLIDFDMSSLVFSLKHMKEKLNWDKLIHDSMNTTYPADGLVIKLRDKKYAKSLGITSHHSKSEMSLKFDNPTAETILLDIVLSAGKHNLTPIGKVKPVEINGVMVSNVNLHNYKYILDNEIFINDTVTIERAGDVIPNIIKSKLTEELERIQFIFDKCPECGGEVNYFNPDIVCLNNDCIGKRISRLMDSITRIGIERLGEPTLRKIIDKYEVNDLIDIFNLDYNHIIKLEGFAETSTNNLLSEIRTVINNGVFEWQILSCLNLQGIGSTLSKDLLKNRSLNDLRLMSYDDLINLNQIGPERAEILVNGLNKNSRYIEELTNLIPIKGDQQTNMNLNGCIFTLTGKMPMGRKEITKMIEEKGGEVKGISKNTNYLVCDDISSGSSKVKKALEYGVSIMNFEQLMELLK